MRLSPIISEIIGIRPVSLIACNMGRASNSAGGGYGFNGISSNGTELSSTKYMTFEDLCFDTGNTKWYSTALTIGTKYLVYWGGTSLAITNGTGAVISNLVLSVDLDGGASFNCFASNVSTGSGYYTTSENARGDSTIPTSSGVATVRVTNTTSNPWNVYLGIGSITISGNVAASGFTDLRTNYSGDLNASSAIFSISLA